MQVTLTGDVSVADALLPTTGVLLRLSLACFLHIPLSSVRIIAASSNVSSTTGTNTLTEVSVSADAPVNSIVGECSDVSSANWDAEARSVRDLFASQPVSVSLSLQVQRECRIYVLFVRFRSLIGRSCALQIVSCGALVANIPQVTAPIIHLLDELVGNTTLGTSNSSLLSTVLSAFVARASGGAGASTFSTTVTARVGSPVIVSSPSPAASAAPLLPLFAIILIACGGGALLLCCLLCLCCALFKQRQHRRKDAELKQRNSFSRENPLRSANVSSLSIRPRVAGEMRSVVVSTPFGRVNPVHASVPRPSRLSGVSTTDRVNPLQVSRAVRMQLSSGKSDTSYPPPTSSKVAVFPGSPTHPLVGAAGSSSRALRRMSAVPESPAMQFQAAAATTYRPKQLKRDPGRRVSSSASRRKARRSASKSPAVSDAGTLSHENPLRNSRSHRQVKFPRSEGGAAARSPLGSSDETAE
jgi:hypothetical protein